MVNLGVYQIAAQKLIWNYYSRRCQIKKKKKGVFVHGVMSQQKDHKDLL